MADPSPRSFVPSPSVTSALSAASALAGFARLRASFQRLSPAALGDRQDVSRSWTHLLHPARWPLLLVLLALLGTWAVGLMRGAESGAAAVLQIDRAMAVRVVGGGTQFPPGTLAQPVALPDVWERLPREGVSTWYRLSFDAPHSLLTRPLLAAHLTQVCSAYLLQLNGQLLALRGEPAQPRPTHCHEPALVTLPPGLLRERGNQLDIQVFGAPLRKVAALDRAGTLGVVRIGPQGLLQAEVEHSRMLRLGLPLALAAVCAMVGVAALVSALQSKLPYLGYFGVASLGWSVLCALLLGVDLPLPPLAVEMLIGALAPPVAVAAVLFLMRYCGLRVDWLESSLALQCFFVLVGLALAAPERVYTVTQPWALILLIELGVALVAFLRRAWQMSRPDFRIGAWATGLAAGVLLLEFLLPAGPALQPGKMAVSAAAIAMFFGMSWRLHTLQQVALEEVQQKVAAAERRTHEVTVEAEQNFDRMAELRIEQVTAKERKRIAADLHDDLGAKLLTIVHTSDNDRISTLAREALEEMRLSVRGLTGRAVQVGDAIGDWRSEVMMRLSQGGVELTWDAPDALLMSERAMSARAYVQTTRILREAVSNVLKHSGATHCEISIRQENNDFELVIADNGKGIPMELDGMLDRGHGMSTMKGRAKQLQGQCLVESGPGYGTTIRLTLPL
ncbi:MAG: sensor histidine kinase [Leptothrix sp. (in: Bacteria)]|jgi:two-component system sensor histidine kinase UhpB|nr:sensor histidine kinase [Leptothrix sp. (in: b-proteobacteria)]